MHDIPGYNGYKLTDDLDIIGKKGNRLTKCRNQAGHQYVNVYVNGTNTILYVHRAVAMVHHAYSYFDGAIVHHRDHNPANNHPMNLEWTTQQLNARDTVSTARDLEAMSIASLHYAIDVIDQTIESLKARKEIYEKRLKELE